MQHVEFPIGECECGLFKSAWSPVRSHVYVVGFRPAPGVLYVKGGKANDTHERLKGFNTHLPGGLSFMWAICITHESVAFAKEKDLLKAIDDLPYSTAVSGEWFSVPEDKEGAVIALLLPLSDRFNRPHPVDVRPATAYDQKRRVRSIKKRATQRERQEELARWRELGEIERKTIKGVAGNGSYGGTPRG